MAATRPVEDFSAADRTAEFLANLTDISPTDRRAHAAAYNYWLSVRTGPGIPSLQQFNSVDLAHLSSNSILLAVIGGGQDAEICFLGESLTQSLAGQDIQILSEAAPPSVLSSVGDKLPELVAAARPLAFQTEFETPESAVLCSGTLLPFTSTGTWADYVYGIVTFQQRPLDELILDSAVAPPLDRLNPVTNPGFSEELSSPPQSADVGSRLADALPQPPATFCNPHVYQVWTSDDANLSERLERARSRAERAQSANLRSRAALYDALSETYDFALAAAADPQGLAEILAAAGLAIQARAPMTPIVKLVFGPSYDKTRVTEFATVLSWARKIDIPVGGLRDRIDAEGGIKAIVTRERQLRHSESSTDKSVQRRLTLRTAMPLATIELEVPGEDEFVLLVARRESSGRLAVLGSVADQQLFDRAVRKAR